MALTYTHKKPLWRGKYVSVRSPIVEKAKKTHQSLKIKYRGKIMTIPYSELSKGIQNREIFQSKIDGGNYTLIDFEWHPDDENQSKLL